MWVTGKLGSARDAALTRFTEEANEQGAVDMGVAPGILPRLGFVPYMIRIPLVKSFQQSLGNSPTQHSDPGAHPHGTSLTDVEQGKSRLCTWSGKIPLATLPASFDVEGALKNLEVLICQDPFLTETAKLAHVVFPACTFAEKDGTVTNQEGKVQYLRPAFDPLGDSTLLDWHIMVGLANGLDSSMDFETTQDIQKEIMKRHCRGITISVTACRNRRSLNPNPILSNGYDQSVQARYQVASRYHRGK